MQALGNAGKRIIAWLILAVMALLLLKVVTGLLVGLAQTVVMLVMLAVVGVGVLWAVRHL